MFIKLTFLFLFIEYVKCANILYLVALPSKSHHIWNREIINSLASRGHNVTVLAPDFDAVPPQNVHYLRLDEIYKNQYLFESRKSVFKIGDVNEFLSPLNFLHRIEILCEGKNESKNHLNGKICTFHNRRNIK